jgi:uncharacterized protein YbjQ (UPF0145 family)
MISQELAVRNSKLEIRNSRVKPEWTKLRLSSFEEGGAVSMIVTTTFSVEGYRIREYKGVVRGIIVRSPTIAQGILGGLKSIIGGRINAYTQMCEQARQQAYDLMIQHAQEVGANAIVGLHYDASGVVDRESATEVLCYGTAVVIEAART